MRRWADGVFVQVQLAEGAHHRLDAAIGQGDAQGRAVQAATVEVDQQVLVVAAPGQFAGAQQLRAAAQQLQHDRQQAVALAIDHDAQLQVEPFMAQAPRRCWRTSRPPPAG
jgi:hydroxypyruvate isomerase